MEIEGLRVLLRRSGSEDPNVHQWIGAAGDLRGAQPAGGTSNDLMSADSKEWRIGVPHFSRVESRKLYRGIDATYYFSDGQLEFDLTIASGANPSAAHFRLIGSQGVAVNQVGRTGRAVPLKQLSCRQPVAHQGSGESKWEVPYSYVVDPSSVGFRVSDYDLP